MTEKCLDASELHETQPGSPGSKTRRERGGDGRRGRDA